MRAFLVGLAIGICLGGSVAYAAGAYGTGYMFGWSVVRGGEEVCSDPFVWAASKEIECD